MIASGRSAGGAASKPRRASPSWIADNWIFTPALAAAVCRLVRSARLAGSALYTTATRPSGARISFKRLSQLRANSADE